METEPDQENTSDHKMINVENLTFMYEEQNIDLEILNDNFEKLIEKDMTSDDETIND